MKSPRTDILYQGRDNLQNIVAVVKCDGFKVHITHVPASFDTSLENMFDKQYMRALYKVGYKTGRFKLAWYTNFSEDS